MSIKVRATRIGFYGSLKYPGDEFEVTEADFQKPWTWVEVIDDGDEPAADGAPKATAKSKAHPGRSVRPAPAP